MPYEKLGYLLGKQAAKQVNFETKVDLKPFGTPGSGFEVKLPYELTADPEGLVRRLKTLTSIEHASEAGKFAIEKFKRRAAARIKSLKV
jgi:hypothetical protein